jgi:hypothetical protein
MMNRKLFIVMAIFLCFIITTTHYVLSAPKKVMLPYPTTTSKNISEIPTLQAFYLRTGTQTANSPPIQALKSTMPVRSSRREQIKEIFRLLHNRDAGAPFECTDNQRRALDYNFTEHSFPAHVKKCRTATQILQGGCLTGCNDFGIMFVTLARAFGIPASLTQTVQQQWIFGMIQKGQWDPQQEGHTFSEVYIEGDWHTVDPVKRGIDVVTNVDQSGKERVLYHIRNQHGDFFMQPRNDGLDFADYGLDSSDLFVQEVKRRYGIPK